MTVKEIKVICPLEPEQTMPDRMRRVLYYALNCGQKVDGIMYADDLEPMKDQTILFAISLEASGVNLELYRMIQKIRENPGFFEGCVGGILIDGHSDFYTKAIGRELVFAANRAGCTFPGRPLVEGTGSLKNFQIQAELRKTDLITAYHLAARNLVERLVAFDPPKQKKPRLLVLHASNFQTSNTWTFWRMVKRWLRGFEIQELSLRNGEISDCGGCPYTMCMHFSEKGKCYYGGPMVDLVHPAIEQCDGLLLLCPNYNDAVSANIAAFINRLTSLYRKTPFFDKYLFGIVVSGYSGGDIVANQLISGLNMNKAFILPAGFAMLETANDPGSIGQIDGIEEEAEAFARRIRMTMVKGARSGREFGEPVFVLDEQ